MFKRGERSVFQDEMSVFVEFFAVFVLIVITQVEAKSVGTKQNKWEDFPSDVLDKLRELAYEQQQPLYDLPVDDVYPDEVIYGEQEAPSAPLELSVVANWPSAKGAGLIGQVGGVAMDTDGNLVVFHRADRRWDAMTFGMQNRINPNLGPINKDVILTLSPETGDVLSHTGSGEFYMPHGLTIDKDGNRWLTDVGLHQVVKIPKNSSTPSLVLGEKLVPGSDDKHFCKPTDVAVASNGEFFVADGYCNGRIMKFAADGKLITKWGRRQSDPTDPGIYEFDIPHSLALDESRDSLCVADRENGRVLCYDAGLNGTRAGGFKKGLYPGRGTIFAIEYDPNDDVLYAVNGPGIGIIEGFTLDMNGNILETWGPDTQEFEQPHDVTVSHDGADVYVGDIGADSRVWKLSRRLPRSPLLGK